MANPTPETIINPPAVLKTDFNAPDPCKTAPTFPATNTHTEVTAKEMNKNVGTIIEN